MIRTRTNTTPTSTRTRITAAAIAVAAATLTLTLTLTVAGCAAPTGAASIQEPITPATVTVTQPSHPTTSTPTPTPVQKGTTAASAVPLGTKLVLANADDTTMGYVAVYAVKKWVPAESYDTSGVAIDVELSLADTAVVDKTFTSHPDWFDAVDAAHHVYKPAIVSMNGPEPAFPNYSVMRPGDTIRGWILLDTTAAVSDLTVSYTLSDGHYFWKTH